MFLKQYILGTKFWGAEKNLVGHCPRMSPVATGLSLIGARAVVCTSKVYAVLSRLVAEAWHPGDSFTSLRFANTHKRQMVCWAALRSMGRMLEIHLFSMVQRCLRLSALFKWVMLCLFCSKWCISCWCRLVIKTSKQAGHKQFVYCLTAKLVLGTPCVLSRAGLNEREAPGNVASGDCEPHTCTGVHVFGDAKIFAQIWCCFSQIMYKQQVLML